MIIVDIRENNSDDITGQQSFGPPGGVNFKAILQNTFFGLVLLTTFLQMEWKGHTYGNFESTKWTMLLKILKMHIKIHLKAS